jgi:hypothetical protein
MLDFENLPASINIDYRTGRTETSSVLLALMSGHNMNIHVLKKIPV